jgi:hypothetical protein
LWGQQPISLTAEAQNVTPERVATGQASVIVGTQFPAGTKPVAIVMTPGVGKPYTANLLDGHHSAFAVQSNGSLAPVTEVPFQTGLHPVALCITSNGRFLYVAVSGDRVSQDSRFPVARR